jgi:spore maturation protein SpmB
MRAAVNPPAANPTDIFLPCMLVTFAATMAAMISVSAIQRINLFQPVILAWIGGLSALIASLIWYLHSLNQAALAHFSTILSNGIILLIFFAFLLGAWWKKVNVFESFVDGAKGGFEIAIRIIPYIIAMLIAISALRNSGVFDYIIQGLSNFFYSIGINADFVPALPTALMKPLSGSGARGMMIDTMNNVQYGADSFVGRLSCIFQGTSDTTFYVVAVYFGAVSIKNTRYAIPVMLLADLVGIITAIVLAYFFFH